MPVLLLLPFLCLATASPAGGLFGLGLLGGDSATTVAGAAAGATNAPTNPLVSVLTGLLPVPAGMDATALDTSLTGMIAVLTGQSTDLPLEAMAALIGINTTPIPSPLSNPLAFLTHPLVVPIILAAITLNPAAVALASGGLVGRRATHFRATQVKQLKELRMKIL